MAAKKSHPLSKVCAFQLHVSVPHALYAVWRMGGPTGTRVAHAIFLTLHMRNLRGLVKSKQGDLRTLAGIYCVVSSRAAAPLFFLVLGPLPYRCLRRNR